MVYVASPSFVLLFFRDPWNLKQVVSEPLFDLVGERGWILH